MVRTGKYVDPMLDPKLIDDLSKRLADNLPVLQDDLRRNSATALRAALSRLDLVTREEFEVQQAVLARTREKLEALAARVAALEAELKGGKTS